LPRISSLVFKPKNLKKVQFTFLGFFVILIANLLNKLQIHIFIVIFEIRQLYLHFSHGNQCSYSSLLTASHSLDGINTTVAFQF